MRSQNRSVPTRVAARSVARVQGQAEKKGCALAEFAFAPDAAAVKLHDVLHDAEAEAGAASFARTAFVHAIESLEDMREIRLGDARTVVADADFNVVGMKPRGNVDA